MTIGMRSENYWNEEGGLLERGDQSMERGVTSRATVQGT